MALDNGLWQEMQHPWVEIKGALCSFGEKNANSLNLNIYNNIEVIIQTLIIMVFILITG